MRILLKLVYCTAYPLSVAAPWSRRNRQSSRRRGRHARAPRNRRDKCARASYSHLAELKRSMWHVAFLLASKKQTTNNQTITRIPFQPAKSKQATIMMMKSTLIVSLLASAAAFAPLQQPSKVTAIEGAFDQEIGVQAPLGFWYVVSKKIRSAVRHICGYRLEIAKMEEGAKKEILNGV